MAKTVLITGASSGFGKEAAKLFHSKGWNVVAAMRSPEKETELRALEGVSILQLDVTDQQSIQASVKQATDTFGSIDVLVNSAGYGLMGVFESADEVQIKKQYEVNVFGLMAVTQAVLPVMRSQKSGVIINISSFGGVTASQFASLYNSSKFAVEGFSEALSHELAFLNIAVKIIEPGGVATNFRNGMEMISNAITDYKAPLSTFMSRYIKRTEHLPKASAPDVANCIYDAATDGTQRLRYVVGSDAQFYIDLKNRHNEQQLLSAMREDTEVLRLQYPVRSGFNAFSTAAEVIRGIDLTGKTAIVTGGYSGIGFETVRALHAAGAKVIVPSRSMERTKALFEGFDDRIELAEMDLMDPVSVTKFATTFVASGQALHLLINNAGIMATPLQRDARGYESQFATNHLGHFQLTAQLWPALKRSNGARVISVSSLGHRFSPVLFDDVNFEHTGYNKWLAYGQSKTANILFALELDRRAREHQVRAFSLHPGRILDTNLSKYLGEEDLKAMGALTASNQPVSDPLNPLKTVEQGAATTVWCATSPQLDGLGGLYCANCDVAKIMRMDSAEAAQTKNSSGVAGVLPYALSSEHAKRLWHLSERLTGINFTF